jgi:hypothetical protein
VMHDNGVGDSVAIYCNSSISEQKSLPVICAVRGCELARAAYTRKLPSAHVLLNF